MGVTTTSTRVRAKAASRPTTRRSSQSSSLGPEWEALLAQMPPDLRKYMIKMTGCLGKSYVPPLDEPAPEDEMYGE